MQLDTTLVTSLRARLSESLAVKARTGIFITPLVHEGLLHLADVDSLIYALTQDGEFSYDGAITHADGTPSELTFIRVIKS